MAIAFVKGVVQRTPYFTADKSTPFAALTLKETYISNGEEKLGGYHDIVAFGDEAQEIGALQKGDLLDVKCNIRYRADKRFVDPKDNTKNPFAVQFVVMSIQSSSHAEDDGLDEEDPFSE